MNPDDYLDLRDAIDQCIREALRAKTPEARNRLLRKADFGSIRVFVEGELGQITGGTKRHSSSARKRVDLLIDRLRRRIRGSDARKRAVERLTHEAEIVFSRQLVPTHAVEWEILPPGEWSEAEFKKYFARISRDSRGLVYQPERIAFALSLRPSAVYLGKTAARFHGYAVFSYGLTNAVIVEHPFVGNALYFVRRQWQTLTRMTKRELLDEFPSDVERVCHIGDWERKIRTLLGVRPKRRSKKAG